MNAQVFYTPAAKETLQSVYEFVLEHFGERSALKFVGKVSHTIKLIEKHPLLYQVSAIDEHVRVAVITKQCSLFYQVAENSINLLFFWDNRQDPITT